MPICLPDLTIQTIPRAGLKNSSLTSLFHIVSAVSASLQLSWTHFSRRETPSKLYCRKVSLFFHWWAGLEYLQKNQQEKNHFAFTLPTAPNHPPPHLLAMNQRKTNQSNGLCTWVLIQVLGHVHVSAPNFTWEFGNIITSSQIYNN